MQNQIINRIALNLIVNSLESNHSEFANECMRALCRSGVYLKYIRPLFNLNKLTLARPGSHKLRHSS